MAENNLGSASLLLRANSAQLMSGLDTAKKGILNLASNVASRGGISLQGLLGSAGRGEAMGKQLGSQIGAGLGSIFGAAGFGAMIGGPIGAAVGLIGGALVGAIEQASSSVFNFLGSFKEMSATANALQIPIDQWSELSAVAAKSQVSTEALAHGMKHLTNELSSAKGGNLEAQTTFAAVGVTMDKLKGKNTAEAFDEIAEAVSKITDPTERAAAAMRVFGERGGIQLTPLLAKGKAGLAELRKEAQSLGVVVSKEEAAKMSNANRAMSTLGSAWQGLVKKLTVAATPFIEWLAKGFTWLAKVVGPVFDAVAKVMEETFKILVAGFSYVVAGVRNLFELLGELPDFLKPNWVDGGLAGIRRFEKETNDFYNSIGKRQKELAKPVGIDEGALERRKKLMDDARHLVGEDPTKKFKDSIAGLDLLLKDKLINERQYADGTVKAFQELMAAAGGTEVKLSGAAFKNSAEAVTAQIKNDFAGKAGNDPASRLQQSQEQIKRIQEKHVKVSEQILAETKRQKEKQGEFNDIGA